MAFRRRDLLAGTAALTLGAGAARADATRTLAVGQSTLTVVIGKSPPVSETTILAWVKRASSMVVNYFGTFPVPTLRVEIVTGGRGSLGWGQHFRGRRLEIHAGRRTTKSDIAEDWVMVHEMMHCAYPWLNRRHRWMREGLSTYLESVVRAEAGVHDADDVWARWLRSMDQGLPDGEGFDDDRSWGATYWGGALFWMLVDVEVRRRTGGKKCLRDGLQVILQKMGNSRVEQKVDKVMAVGDRATGTTVFSEYYKAYGQEGRAVDLDAFFKKLGVVPTTRGHIYREDAPWAAVRRGMYKKRHDLPALR